MIISRDYDMIMRQILSIEYRKGVSMKFRTDKKAIPAKEIKSGVVGGHTYTLASRYF